MTANLFDLLAKAQELIDVDAMDPDREGDSSVALLNLSSFVIGCVSYLLEGFDDLAVISAQVDNLLAASMAIWLGTHDYLASPFTVQATVASLREIVDVMNSTK